MYVKLNNVFQVSSNEAGFTFYFVLIIIKSLLQLKVNHSFNQIRINIIKQEIFINKKYLAHQHNICPLFFVISSICIICIIKQCYLFIL